jgi:hypothetical protein
VASAGKYSVWSAEGLPSMFRVGGWVVGSVLVGLQVGSAWQPVGWRAGKGSIGLVAHLFFQCTVGWRSLPWARGSGCQSFSFFWFFTSAKHISSISTKFLIHGVYTVCFCVPVSILDPLLCPQQRVYQITSPSAALSMVRCPVITRISK